MKRLDLAGYGGIGLVADAFGAAGDPVVLLLPAPDVAAAVWREAAAALADAGRHAIVLGSARERSLDEAIGDLVAVLAALPSRAFVVAAGGKAAVATAATGEGTPHLVSGLALVDPAAGRRERERIEAAALRINGPVAQIDGLAERASPYAIDLGALIPDCERLAIDRGSGSLGDRVESFNAVLLDVVERRAPRQPLSYLGGAEPRLLRDALGCFGTGVTVVTTIDPSGKPAGLTANSFTSVSLDPPLILFSLAKSSSSLAAFETAGRFAVNVLHIGQQPVAGHFTRKDVDRFDGMDWAIRAEGGSPILAGSLASFDCRTHSVQEAGDHLILIGRVDHAWFEPHRDPLFYFRGKYRRLHFA